MSKPLVSIIIPTYNRADLIGESLDSIISQTYQNWECIVVDDGSTDNTADLVKKYSQKDSRIQYHKRPSSYQPGGNGARNYGFNLANGNYIKWLDSDDLLHENQLELEINAFQDEAISLSISNWEYFRGKKSAVFKLKSNPYTVDDFLHHMAVQNYIFPPHCYLVKKETVFRSGLWNEFLKVNQDGEFFFRVFCYSLNVYYRADSIAFKRTEDETNLSNYGNFTKMNHRINSWKMMEFYAQQSGIGKEYIRSGKKRLYAFLLKTNRTDFIKANFLFFSEFIGWMDFPKMYFRYFKTKFFRK